MQIFKERVRMRHANRRMQTPSTRSKVTPSNNSFDNDQKEYLTLPTAKSGGKKTPTEPTLTN